MTDEKLIHVWDLDGPACDAGVGYITHDWDEVNCAYCLELMQIVTDGHELP